MSSNTNLEESQCICCIRNILLFDIYGTDDCKLLIPNRITAKWSGARLADVLKDAYDKSDHCKEQRSLSRENAKQFQISHVVFRSADGLEASIPATKALDLLGDCLLAYRSFSLLFTLNSCLDTERMYLYYFTEVFVPYTE